MKPKIGIFLSHNTKDKPFVRRLAHDLRNHGVYIWLDEAEIKVGDSLINKIQSAIDEMDYLAVVLSRNSVNSEWVKRELEIAISEEIEKRKIKILPILLEDCQIPGFLRGKYYADFRQAHDPKSEKYVKGIELLLDSIGLTQGLFLEIRNVTDLSQDQLSHFLYIFRDKDHYYIPDISQTGAPYELLRILCATGYIEYLSDRHERTYFLTEAGKRLRAEFINRFAY